MLKLARLGRIVRLLKFKIFQDGPTRGVRRWRVLFVRDLRPGAEVDDPRGGRLSASYVKPQSCCGQCLYTAMGVGSEVIVTSKDVRTVGMVCGNYAAICALARAVSKVFTGLRVLFWAVVLLVGCMYLLGVISRTVPAVTQHAVPLGTSAGEASVSH